MSEGSIYEKFYKVYIGDNDSFFAGKLCRNFER